ncbi:hypothetical protein [Rhizobium sp. BK377]|uniref:hypothetical protein n=1 Tax=Rhizobium sp. BK377 TaxID=2587058 RepID=UPI0016182752|nr:hypothetical protein [Rhizobium sp. BK377]MBB3461466.1 hypothetical protein [Rhizobium sp. BK377]
MRSLHYLLLIFVAPPLIALGLIFLVISWSGKEQPDPRPTGTVGVKKGDRIGTPTEPHPPR